MKEEKDEATPSKALRKKNFEKKNKVSDFMKTVRYLRESWIVFWQELTLQSLAVSVARECERVQGCCDECTMTLQCEELKIAEAPNKKGVCSCSKNYTCVNCLIIKNKFKGGLK